jgi:hypothetical protein
VILATLFVGAERAVSDAARIELVVTHIEKLAGNTGAHAIHYRDGLGWLQEELGDTRGGRVVQVE